MCKKRWREGLRSCWNLTLYQKHRIMQLKDFRIVHGTMHNHIWEMREKLLAMTFNLILKVKVCANLVIFHNSSTSVENLGSPRCLLEKKSKCIFADTLPWGMEKQKTALNIGTKDYFNKHPYLTFLSSSFSVGAPHFSTWCFSNKIKKCTVMCCKLWEYFCCCFSDRMSSVHNASKRIATWG